MKKSSNLKISLILAVYVAATQYVVRSIGAELLKVSVGEEKALIYLWGWPGTILSLIGIVLGFLYSSWYFTKKDYIIEDKSKITLLSTALFAVVILVFSLFSYFIFQTILRIEVSLVEIFPEMTLSVLIPAILFYLLTLVFIGKTGFKTNWKFSSIVIVALIVGGGVLGYFWSPEIIKEPMLAQQTSAGVFHTLAIKTDGTLWAWGRNNRGQLGLDDTKNRYLPTQVGTDTDWERVTAGSLYTLTIKTDGTLWAWGRNNRGQLGLDDTEDRYLPTQVGTDTDWELVDVGSDYILGIKKDGTLWAWGRNDHGQLGLGDTEDRYLPTQVGTGTNWRMVTAGSFHSLSIKTDGTLWAWGHNGWNQLGLGDAEYRYLPTQVGTDTDWERVTAGRDYTLAIKTDGTLWAWGDNYHGQLGLGDTEDRYLPTQVSTDTDWELVVTGSLSIKTDGTLWAWGGLGDAEYRYLPTQVGTDTDWELVVVGSDYILGIKTDNSLWSWGGNYFGELGLGDTEDRYSPVPVKIVHFPKLR